VIVFVFGSEQWNRASGSVKINSPNDRGDEVSHASINPHVSARGGKVLVTKPTKTPNASRDVHRVVVISGTIRPSS
jgi:hypothetical protein